jgi:nitrite reductase/ring-hydroxylating ferredoxin subunit
VRPRDHGEPGTVLDLGPVDEVLPRGRARVEVGRDGTPVLIVRNRRGVFAMRNRCPHRGVRLDDAKVRGKSIKCAFHGREYDLRSGDCRSKPPGRRDGRLTTYRCWVDRGRLLLAVPAERS